MMYEQNETIIRDRTMKNQTEILELKNKINELRDFIALGQTTERISKLEERTSEITEI